MRFAQQIAARGSLRRVWPGELAIRRRSIIGTRRNRYVELHGEHMSNVLEYQALRPLTRARVAHGLALHIAASTAAFILLAASPRRVMRRGLQPGLTARATPNLLSTVESGHPARRNTVLADSAARATCCMAPSNSMSSRRSRTAPIAITVCSAIRHPEWRSAARLRSRRRRQLQQPRQTRTPRRTREPRCLPH